MLWPLLCTLARNISNEVFWPFLCTLALVRRIAMFWSLLCTLTQTILIEMFWPLLCTLARNISNEMFWPFLCTLALARPIAMFWPLLSSAVWTDPIETSHKMLLRTSMVLAHPLKRVRGCQLVHHNERIIWHACVFCSVTGLSCVMVHHCHSHTEVLTLTHFKKRLPVKWRVTYVGHVTGEFTMSDIFAK